MAALTVPKPSKIMMLNDSSRPGIDSNTSTRRITASSAMPPTAPAISPSAVPNSRPKATATSAADSVCEAP
ncbi:hypothetical protein D3C80_2172760 [compost metagenome]